MHRMPGGEILITINYIMKTIIKISVAVLSVLLLGTMFSSCTKIDPSSNKVSYVAEGKVSGGLSSSIVLPTFQSAINSAVGGGYVEPNDNKVIAACDNVNNRLKDDKTLDGTVKIVKKPYNGGSTTVIKTYTFKKSK